MPDKLVSDARNGPLNRERLGHSDQGHTVNHEGMSPEDGKDIIDHLNHEETTSWNSRRQSTGRGMNLTGTTQRQNQRMRIVIVGIYVALPALPQRVIRRLTHLSTEPMHVTLSFCG